jgi:putative glutamine amidotransferase
MRKARIGVSCNLALPETGRELYPGKALQYAEGGLVRAVARAGALPLLLPHLEPEISSEEAAAHYLETLDAVIIAGGADVDPSFYGEEVRDERWRGQPSRDRIELSLIRGALARRIPVLGICRGHQILNVALGGTLFQDLPSMKPSDIRHRDQATYDKNGHPITVVEGSRLASLLGAGTHFVNSVHHQAIKNLAPGLRAVAHAADGIIEAVEGEGCLGLQFHPEWMPESPLSPAIFADLLARIAR